MLPLLHFNASAVYINYKQKSKPKKKKKKRKKINFNPSSSPSFSPQLSRVPRATSATEPSAEDFRRPPLPAPRLPSTERLKLSNLKTEKEAARIQSVMNSTRQLIDSLTSHLSLYNSNSSNLNLNPNPNPRSSIIKWFSSLSVHQRQAHLTTVDVKFTQLLLQMLHKLKTNGYCIFIVLPDIPHSSLPTHSGTSSSSLPSLCFRKSHGLLSRFSELNESERLIRDSTRLFSSKEGENIKEFSVLGQASCIDSMTVTEEFVENVDRFVEIMDGVSNGQFLRGEQSGGLGAEWVEMEWLKAKGYYSMEAFVVNKLEVALRLAWLNCTSSGKKRGVKLKEKMNGVGIAANLFWRKKGCLDWWGKLDKEMKRKMFRMVVGRAAKCLAAESLQEKNFLGGRAWMQSSGHKDNFMSQENTVSLQTPDSKVGDSMTSVSVCGNHCSLSSVFKSLVLLQDISSMLLACQDIEHDEGKIFFSSLDAVSTTSDCILRKLRELLMVVSLDCTKCELLGEGNGNPSTKKQKERLHTNDHKKKGKNRSMKRPKPMTRAPEDDTKLVKGTKDIGNGFLCSKSADVCESSRMADKILKKDLCTEPLPTSVNMGCTRGLNNGNSQNASRKSRKERKKLKSSNSQMLVGVEGCQTREAKVAPISINSGNEAPKSDWIAEDTPVENVSDTRATGNEKHEQRPKDCKSTSEGIHLSGLKDCQNTSMVVAANEEAPIFQSVKCDMDPSATPIIPLVSSDDDLGRCVKTANSDQKNAKSIFLGKLGKGGDLGTKVVPIHEQGSIGLYDIGIVNSSVYLSYEWPSVAPSQVPPCNSHLPAATDRLHLDVGHNWQNHFHQSFVPAVHQMRNLPLENGCNGVVSRPVPMSLDLPPVVRGVNARAPSVACNYDSGFISRRQSGYQQGFSASNVQRSLVATDDERVYTNDFVDFSDLTNSQEVVDEHENHCFSEEELELHAVSGMDYNQYFGGGVMYWNPSDFPGSNFSRPPSLSSDDSSWAWREADMNRAVDDMVAFSSSYSTNGLTSPSAASFCSSFDTKGPGHQALGYVLSESEIGGKVLHSSSTTDPVADENASVSTLSCDGEAKTGDSLPYPILRPIIIPNISRDRSRSDFKHSHDRKSPCIPPSREQPRIKRPPSPVVLCVPRAPRPPPPSPAGSSRRHRGFPTVRSGSSSPRHWGVKGWSYDGINFEETCIRMGSSEVVWPSWRSKSLSAHQLTQPVPGALLQDRLIAISQLARDQEHPDVAFPLQPPELLSSSTHKASLSMIHTLLHDEIDSFCKKVATENLTRKPYINWAVKRVTRSLQVLWPRSRTNVFGSNATGLSLPSSDVDLVVCLPPVRNLEPIKEAGILEGRNGIKETCLQHAARYLANQEWVKNDSLKIVENTAIPIIMLVVEVPHDLMPSSASNLQASKVASTQTDDPVGSESHISGKCTEMKNETGKAVNSVRLDISFKSPSHTGLQTTELVKELTEQFPAATPLALVLKKFLADRSLDQSYSGGLSSYCLVLLIIRFLQHEHHLGRPINQNYGSLLMDFLYFFGNVFDPRQMRVSVQGSGVYINREQGYSIDPMYIDDPLFPTNNVGRNCFRIHQCIKAFADAYSTLENELTSLPNDDDLNSRPTCKLLPKVIPSISHISVGS